MNTKQVMTNLQSNNTGGYFYKDNCRINHSTIYGWYCKDFVNGKMNTYNINETTAELKIFKSLGDIKKGEVK